MSYIAALHKADSPKASRPVPTRRIKQATEPRREYPFQVQARIHRGEWRNIHGATTLELAESLATDYRNSGMKGFSFRVIPS